VKIYSLILIISLIIVGILFNLFMIDYIYTTSIFINKKMKENLNTIDIIEKKICNDEYDINLIYGTNSSTLLKIIFDNGVEGIIIQEE
jgi:hypothetical protein